MIGAATRRVRKPERETEPADEFDRADDIAPEQAVLEADAFQEFGGGGFVAEQDRIAVDGQRAARHHADQRLGERRDGAVEQGQRRNHQTRLLLHGHPISLRVDRDDIANRHRGR